MDGVLPIFKDRGITSASCVYKVRSILGVRKAGHIGTLDPNVNGVLPICIGQATKLVSILMNRNKEYIGEMTLGVSTDTDDLDGKIKEKKKLNKPFSLKQIDFVFQNMLGTIYQTPPIYSAIKINGKRLYEYARNGEKVNIPKRKIKIYEFCRLGIPFFDDDIGIEKIKFRVQCSKGTYIRSLVSDFGKALNVPSVMSSLTRTKSGGFSIEDTIKIDDLIKLKKNNDNFYYDKIYSIKSVLKNDFLYDLNYSQWVKVSNGCNIILPHSINKDKIVLVYDKLVKAIYQHNGNYYSPYIMLLNNHGVNGL